MVRTFRNALVLIAAFFGITLCSDLAFSQATKMPGPVPPKRLEEYSAYAALWRTDGNFRSTIRISNQLETREIDAELTIYMADGTSWDLPSVHLAKSGVTTVDINEALAGAPDAVRSHLSTYGSARLRYHYDWQGTVYATLSILDLVRSLDYTVPFVFPPDQGKGETFLTKELRALRDTAANGTRYEGLWFRDGHNGGGFLALSNTTDSAFSADVQLSGMRSNVDRKAVIQGHSTVLLDLRDMFGMDDTRVGGITITHSGKSGALQVIGGLEDLTKGYSATLTLMPIVAKTKTNAASVRQYASAGLMVNEQNSHLGFPAGVQFVPYVFFRNLAPQVRTIHVTGYYAEGNTTTETKSLTLPDVMLEPGQAQELDIRDAMKSRPQISDINLLFSYTGDYGDILAATGSTDGTGNYVFPVIPQAVGPSGTRTSIYWEVAGGFDTMYTVWNPTAIPQELVAIIHYGKSGEKFTLPLHLNEYASAMIDIGELIRTQQADQDQNVLPQDTHEGSLEVSAATQQPEDLITVALAEGIYNPTKATCGFGCETCSGVTTWGIDPGSFSIPMSQNSQGQFFYQMASGGQYYATSSSHWGSGNTSIASVQDMGQSNPGLATGVGAGSTTISATYIANLPVNAGQICTPLPLPLCPTQGGWTGQSPVQVPQCQVPTGESTAYVQQVLTDQYSPTASDFLQTLSVASGSASADAGSTVQESEGQAGNDSCWWSGSPYAPSNSVLGSHWIVGGITPGDPESQVVVPGPGQWGPDEIGWAPGPVKWYQQNNPPNGKPIPCGTTVYQSLSLACPSQSPVGYIYNQQLSSTIDSTGLTNCRAGVCAPHYGYR